METGECRAFISEVNQAESVNATLNGSSGEGKSRYMSRCHFSLFRYSEVARNILAKPRIVCINLLFDDTDLINLNINLLLRNY